MDISGICYRLIRKLVHAVYPKMELTGTLPEGPSVIVANHTQMNGPIACEFYLPGDRAIWCASQMMKLREVPGYAYEDFWSFKPKLVRPFYRLLSYLIAPLSVLIFNHAHTIPVYRDTRVLSTFRESLETLDRGGRIVIFPEKNQPYNNILYEFQDRFIDLGRMYCKRTGQALAFVPMYIAPKLRRMVVGEPVRYDPSVPPAEERERICRELMERITDLAAEQPLHTVVPYRNIKKRDYPKNLPVQDRRPKTAVVSEPGKEDR